jgi:IS30 family transposase
MASHLTFEERERLSQMHHSGANDKEIGATLGRHPTTIGRELRRNAADFDEEYSPLAAQYRASLRRRHRPLARKMDRPEVRKAVCSRLVERWSPDQIAGRLKREHPHNRRRRVSHQTIYAWIRCQPSEVRRRFRSFLRRGGKRRPRNDRRGQLAGAVSIAGRPKVVDARRRYGDWEGDTVVGARQSGAIVTLVERKSGFLLTAKSCDRQARRVADKIVSRLGELPRSLRRSATFDNGKEFAEHARMTEKLALPVYFAKPYCSWQRGTNENTNGLLRQFIPKGTDFGQVSWQELAYYTDLLNDRPRKRLDYRTPAEVFDQQVAIEN